MARNNVNTRSVTITESNAKPVSEKEIKETIQMIANALEGTYGDGDWDGGITGANGFYTQYARYWDAKLVYTLNGSADVVFPFTVVESFVRVTNVITKVTVINYIEKSRRLGVSGDGKYILEVCLVKNTKEVQ